MSDAIAGASDEATEATDQERAEGAPAAEPAHAADRVDAAAVEDAPREVSEPNGAARGDAWYKAEATAERAIDSPTAGSAASDTAPVELTAADMTTAASTPLAAAVASSRSRRRERVHLRPAVTLGLFALGLLIGAIGWRLVNPPPVAVDSLPALSVVGEPPVAAVVARHLAANDAQALSDSLDQEVLDAIRSQTSPLATLERVTFVNAASIDDQILSAYVVEGTDSTGARGIVGLILIVRDGAVVAQ